MTRKQLLFITSVAEHAPNTFTAAAERDYAAPFELPVGTHSKSCSTLCYNNATNLVEIKRLANR